MSRASRDTPSPSASLTPLPQAGEVKAASRLAFNLAPFMGAEGGRDPWLAPVSVTGVAREGEGPGSIPQYPRQPQSVILGAVNCNLITRIGMTPDAGSRIIPQYTLQPLGRSFRPVGDNDDARVL